MAESGAQTLESLVRDAGRSLQATSEDGLRDARLLAGEAFGLDAAGLVLNADMRAGDEARRRFEALVARRRTGEPVHRILGRRGFYDHVFELSAQTLEPRPDTEILVDLAARTFRDAYGDRSFLFADIGTGTGAIAISLLALFPEALCLAVDIAPGALLTARRNARSAGVDERFHPVAGDYLGALAGPVDAIVSNPPYIPSDEIEDLAVEVRAHDPRLALDGGSDGLTAYRAIARGAQRLAPRDILLEIGAGQGDDVASIFAACGFGLTEATRDLGGHVRALAMTNSR